MEKSTSHSGRFQTASLALMLLLAAAWGDVNAQDTFSIVAVDTVTGEIGSAGASCVGPFGGVGAFIISDVIEGVGAIHTQAYYQSQNQQNAHNQMVLGRSPQEIIDWLVANDVQNNPTIRQYGVVDLRRNGASAAHTGLNCDNFKGHLTGPGYAIQGNILLGQVILDTLRAGLLNTPGPLADRLMAALENAKIVGADTRCFVRNTSTQSAFIKVVRLGDGNSPYLQEIVPDSPIGTDPIGLLRVQFDQWKASLAGVVDPFRSQAVLDADSLPADGSSQALVTILPRNNADSLLASGLTILLANSGGGVIGPVTDLGNGAYVASVTAPPEPGGDTLSIAVVSGADTVAFAATPVLRYFPATGIAPATPRASLASESIHLYPNYPNPFNPSTTIRFALSPPGHTAGGDVELAIYNSLGEKIRTLLRGRLSSGVHEAVWDGRSDTGAAVASGIYYYQVRMAEHIVSRRLVLLR